MKQNETEDQFLLKPMGVLTHNLCELDGVARPQIEMKFKKIKLLGAQNIPQRGQRRGGPYVCLLRHIMAVHVLGSKSGMLIIYFVTKVPYNLHLTRLF
jgi:hypothetical protein